MNPSNRIPRLRAALPAAFAVMLVVLGATASAALAVTPKFAGPAMFAVGDRPRAVATADFNGDGKLDTVVANKAAGTVSLLLGKGDGTFQAAKTFKVGAEPVDVLAADLNGDGKQDVAVANYGSNSVTILLGNGAGDFEAPQTVTVGNEPIRLAAGDLNTDGRLELAVTNYGGASISILTQAAPGVFTATTHPISGVAPFLNEGPREIAIVDADGDGKLDIVFATYFRRFPDFTDNLGIWYGDGNGGFTASSPCSVPDGPMALYVGDYDHNGLTEIVGASWTINEIWVLRQSAVGARSFVVGTDKESPVWSGFGNPGDMVFADVNGDTVPDIVASVPGSDVIKVALSRYRTPFWELAAADQTVATYAAGDRPGALCAADVSRDGAADLLVADYGSDRMSVLRKTWPIRHGAAFEPAVQTDLGANEFKAMAIADVSGPGGVTDGLPDLVSTQSLLQSAGIDAIGKVAPFSSATAELAGDDVCVADFNHDGLLDTAVVDTAGNVVRVALRQPGGALGPAVAYATGAGPVRVITGDVNRDGNLDLLTSNAAGNSVSVLLGDGAGGFAAHVDVAVGSQPDGLALGDLNGDGSPDLTVANHGATTVSVALGNDTAAFGAASSVTLPFAPRDVGLGDFNRDGRLDLVAGADAGNLAVLPGNGNGGFGTAITATSASGAGRIVVADFTTDGKLDVAATTPHTAGPGVSIMAGDGTGALADALDLSIPSGTVEGLTSGDLNADGVVDLVVGAHDPAAPANGRVYVFQNDTWAPTSAPVFPKESPDIHLNHGWAQIPGDATGRYWTSIPRTINLHATDDGAGVDKTYRIVAGQPVAMTQISVAAPKSTVAKYDLVTYAQDKVGNAEDYLTVPYGVDTAPPVLADDAKAGWTNAAVTTVKATADDGEGCGFVPLTVDPESYIHFVGWGFSVDKAVKETDSTLYVPGVFDQTNDGVHVITETRYDGVLNKATGTITVRVDTLRPLLAVSTSLSARAGGFFDYRYRINDGTKSCGLATVRLLVRNSSGRTVATWNLGRRPTNKSLLFEMPAPLARGTYSLRLYATDVAGNIQQKIGITKLTVR